MAQWHGVPWQAWAVGSALAGIYEADSTDLSVNLWKPAQRQKAALRRALWERMENSR